MLAKPSELFDRDAEWSDYGTFARSCPTRPGT